MTLTEGLLGIPRVLWLDSNGRRITSTPDVILTTPVTNGQTTNQSIYFDPIRRSDGGTYICMAMVASSALTVPLNSSAVYTLTVQQSKFWYTEKLPKLYALISLFNRFSYSCDNNKW